MVERASVHEVGADEAGKFEGAMYRCLSELGHAQDEKSDQGDDDLNADSILGDPDEVLDSKRLLDPAKEQFDLPALFVKLCDLFCRRVEIIGDDAQLPAALDDHADLPDRNLQRILAAVGEPGRQMTDAVGHNVAVLGDAVLLHHTERSVLLQPRSEEHTSELQSLV